MTQTLVRLHDLIDDHFSLEELKNLCFALNVEFENLAGETRSAKARELILHIGRQNRFNQLLDEIEAERPNAFSEDGEGLPNNDETIVQLVTEFPAYINQTKSPLERLRDNQLVIFGLLGLILAAVIVTAVLVVRSGRTADEAEPVVLSGDFNIAVVPFGQLNDNDLVETYAREEFSVQIFELISTTVQPLNDGRFLIEVVGPNQLEPLTGGTEQLADEAEQLAGEIGADVVVYGYVERSGSGTRLHPKFYVDAKNLRQAQELSGEYGWADGIDINDDIESNAVARTLLQDDLAVQTNVLADLVIGLGYFALDRFADAETYFESAADFDTATADIELILLLFRGSTAAKKQDLNLAESLFDDALAIDPAYGRALIGKAQTVFIAARGSCQAADVDPAGIENALLLFQSAATSIAPAHSNLQAKAALGLGNLYFCESEAGLADRWDFASQQYRVVTNAFEAGNDQIGYLAAEAYGGQALLLLSQATEENRNTQFRLALEQHGAAENASPHLDRQMNSLAWQAWIHLQLDECEFASADIEEAKKRKERFESEAGIGVNADTQRFLDSVEAQQIEDCP